LTQDTPSGPRRGALVVLGATVLCVLAIDLLTKQLALSGLVDGKRVRLLGGAVWFDLTRNSGAAFSIGSGFTWVFPLIAIVVMGAILYLARRLRSTPWALSLGLILGGAMGNFIDRLFRAPGPLQGHVVDFISVFAPAGERFPIFNAADSALFCGVVLAIILEFTGRRRDGTRVVTTPERPTAPTPAGVRDSQGDEPRKSSG
jgi:signal peptidase II